MIIIKSINKAIEEQYRNLIDPLSKIIITLKINKALLNSYKVYTLTTYRITRDSKEVLFEYSNTSKNKESAIEACLYETLQYFFLYFYDRGKSKTNTNRES